MANPSGPAVSGSLKFDPGPGVIGTFGDGPFGFKGNVAIDPFTGAPQTNFQGYGCDN